MSNKAYPELIKGYLAIIPLLVNAGGVDMHMNHKVELLPATPSGDDRELMGWVSRSQMKSEKVSKGLEFRISFALSNTVLKNLLTDSLVV